MIGKPTTLLEKVLDNIKIETLSKFYDLEDDGGFEGLIQKSMPGYIIDWFDMDDVDALSQAVDTIACDVKGKTIEDIQTCEWSTEEGDLVCYVVAIKEAENEDASEN